MPRIIHFELPVEDAKRASKFYGDVFAWDVQGWAIPNIGFAAYIQDPEGNTVGLFEAVSG